MAFSPGQTLSAAQLQALGASSTYTPVLTGSTSNPNLGSGGQAQGWYHVNGQHVSVWFMVRFGTSGTSFGSGFYEISGPPGYTYNPAMPGLSVGIGRALDDNGSTERGLSVLLSRNSGAAIVVFSVLETHLFVTNTVPWTWENQDILMGSFSFLTA